MTWPILPSLSAYSMFWPGTAKPDSASRNSAKLRARLTFSIALISSLGRWPVQLSANGPEPDAATAAASCGASDNTGPQRVSRISTSRSNHQRTAIRSRRVVIAASSASKSELEAARMLVPPHAIQGLRPMAMKGIPGIISPTAW